MEDLPQANLLYMNGNDLKYEVRMEEAGRDIQPVRAPGRFAAAQAKRPDHG